MNLRAPTSSRFGPNFNNITVRLATHCVKFRQQQSRRAERRRITLVACRKKSGDFHAMVRSAGGKPVADLSRQIARRGYFIQAFLLATLRIRMSALPAL